MAVLHSTRFRRSPPTAAFVMGLDAVDLIEAMDGYELFLITHDDTTLWSPGFSGYRAPDVSS